MLMGNCAHDLPSMFESSQVAQAQTTTLAHDLKTFAFLKLDHINAIWYYDDDDILDSYCEFQVHKYYM